MGGSIPAILVQPKRLALVAYVALAAPGGFVRRDLLLSHLWPDLDDAGARNALNKAVHHVRHALGDGVLINRGDEELGFATDRLRCDAVDFARASDREDWEEAIRLYGGDLLPGFYLGSAPSFEEWLEGERSRLKRLAARAARHAAEARAASGDIAGAVEAARRAIVLDPDDEPAVRHLFELLDQQGDRAGAMRVYEEFAARLDREYGVEPDAETLSLLSAFRARTARVDDALLVPRPLRPAEDAAPATPTRGAPRARRRIWWVGLAVAAVVGVVFGAIALRNRLRTHPLPTGTALAVLPFVPSTGDTALVRLGRDLMVLVGARLDGIAGIEVMDPIAVLAHVDALSARGTSGELSRSLRSSGASRVLEGSLVQQGERLRVDAALYAVGRRTPLARVSISTTGDDIGAFADSITLQLAKQVWAANAPHGSEAPTLTTQSLPALRAFLDGELALADTRSIEAREHYRRAIEADGTFWYAYWRSIYVGEWIGARPDSAAMATLAAHREELPEPVRSLFEARLIRSLEARGRRFAELTGQYPRSWSVWFDYADFLVHWGPLYGWTRTEARAALEQSVLLNPGFSNAWEHIFELSLLDRDTVTADRALSALTRLHNHARPIRDDGFDQMLNARWLNALARASGQQQGPLADSNAAVLVAYRGPIPTAIFDILPLRYGWPNAQIEFGRKVRAMSPTPPLADGQARGIALAWATRGAWDSALATADEYAATSPGPIAYSFRYRLAVIATWVGALPPTEAVQRRSALRSLLSDLSEGSRSEVAWLDGVLAAVQGDAQGLEAARRRVRTGAAPTAGWLDRSLAALALEMAGAHAAAVKSMASLEADRGLEHPYAFAASRQPYLTAVNRMVLSRGLAASGDTVGALRQLRWAEATPPGSALEQARVVMTGLVDLERARLEAANGQAELAQIHYRQFLRRYDMPVPAHRHLVDEAQATLNQLEAIGCPGADSACGNSN